MAKKVAKECTVCNDFGAQMLQAKLPEVKEVSDKFSQIPKEQLLRCTGCLPLHAYIELPSVSNLKM